MERVKRKMLAYILSPVSSSCIHFVAGAFALGQHILCTDLYLKSCVSVASHIALVQLHSDSSRRPNNKKRRGLPRLRTFVYFLSSSFLESSGPQFSSFGGVCHSKCPHTTLFSTFWKRFVVSDDAGQGDRLRVFSLIAQTQTAFCLLPHFQPFAPELFVCCGGHGPPDCLP